MTTYLKVDSSAIPDVVVIRSQYFGSTGMRNLITFLKILLLFTS